jgi:phospholipase/lecithinase/hemolysin
MARREFPTLALDSTAASLPAALATRLETLHARGARNFLTFTLSALAHAPKYSQPGGIGHNVSAFLARGIAAYNAALPGAMTSWAENMTTDGDTTNVMVYPWEALFDLMLENQEAFGITEQYRFRIDVDGEGRDPGQVGMVYQDPSHPTWPIAQ